MDIISENLLRNDLEDMVLPLVSFNEYDSKIKDDAVVLGFYVRNEAAAQDLAIFLDRSTVTEIMDCEVSPAVTEEGYYMTFVELDNTVSPQNIYHLFEIAQHLTGKMKWHISAYGVEKKVPVTLKNISILLKIQKRLIATSK